MAAVTRKSVPLDAVLEDAIQRFRLHGAPENQALWQVTGIRVDDDTSEAEVLRALLHAGCHAVEEKAMENGYAALAAAHDEEDRAYEAAVRARGARRRSRVGTGE
ncbi:hypothetical protein OHR86_18545 [Streptomyces sp. NBC_00441]|uniref:hypothetical protein n=1 Tax=Streptomyces sp. NBC_00441 TaxID=2975742 RepID=UPI002E2E3A54|nr:hypothetical protein [Streptomyces sp. NBC_00441]